MFWRIQWVTISRADLLPKLALHATVAARYNDSLFIVGIRCVRLLNVGDKSFWRESKAIREGIGRRGVFNVVLFRSPVFFGL